MPGPTPIKALFMFSDRSGTGWTESHYRLSDSSQPDLAAQLSNAVNNVAQQRRLILGENCYIHTVRVSYPQEGAIASLSTSVFLDGAAGQADVSPALSLAVKFVNGTKNRKKICHVRGFWDSVETNGEYHPEGGPGFEERLNDWKAALISQQYGWLGQDPATTGKGRVTNYATNPDGTITFTLLPYTVALPPVNTVTSIKFSRINKSKSVLNDQFQVVVVDGNHVRTIDPVAAGPFFASGTYTIRALSFLQYAQVYSIKLGRRQQGRPIGLLPGRGPVRARN